MDFPREDEDRGVSLADMAQRDLDAVLQLLADRAQYITGASGAAIALRRDGRDDMLCRASVGSNAPELGALLSTELGLSGESVRTRQLQRCDDAERDVRVNREVCRLMGIASVLVMPVINDDRVLGVFELFSGKANAFGKRDLSAVQRLNEMVETAVRLANATVDVPEQLSAPESSVAEVVHPEVVEGPSPRDLVVEQEVQPPREPQPVETLAAPALESPVTQAIPPAIEISSKMVETAVRPANATVDVPEQLSAPESSVAEVVHPEVVEGPSPRDLVVEQEVQPPREPQPVETLAAAALESPVTQSIPPVIEISPKEDSPERQEGSAPPAVPAVSEPDNVPGPVDKPLSAARAAGEGEAVRSGTDQSHVPPVLRGLRKCEVCGFPISSKRILCVECEEQKWRALLWTQEPARKPPPGIVAVPDAGTTGLALTAAPASTDTTKAPAQDPGDVEGDPGLASTRFDAPAENSGPTPRGEPTREVSPAFSDRLELIFTAGLEPSRSWLSANRYVCLALLAIGIVVAMFLLFR